MRTYGFTPNLGPTAKYHAILILQKKFHDINWLVDLDRFLHYINQAHHINLWRQYMKAVSFNVNGFYFLAYA